MKVRRRIILQLTPLLDLLLVVIFAQYMDLQSASRKMVRQAERQRQRVQVVSARQVEQERALREKTQAEADLRIRDAQKLRDDAIAQMNAITKQFEPLARRNSELTRETQQLATQAKAMEKEIAELSKDNLALAKKLDDKLAQERIAAAKARKEAEARAMLKSKQDLDAIGKIVREMLNVDAAAMQETLSGRPAGETARVLDELQALRNAKNAAAIVRHLQKTVELKKRCDFWEIHLLADDSVRVKIRGKVVDPKMFFRDEGDFTSQLLELIKRQDDPKNLVLILVSYSQVRYATRKMAFKGLNTVVSFLDSYWKSTRRMHVADLGYTQETP